MTQKQDVEYEVRKNKMGSSVMEAAGSLYSWRTIRAVCRLTFHCDREVIFCDRKTTVGVGDCNMVKRAAGVLKHSPCKLE